DRVLFPVEKVLGFLPKIRINDNFIKLLANGNAIPKSSLSTYPGKFALGVAIRVCDGSDKILAVVESLVDQNGFERLNPKDIAFKLKRVLI
ncbi:MAG: tRNA pseudouridine(55) synthase TruB, partial [Nitrospinaceae bacterium]